jgi:phenylalanyl-tRNA synthetase beta chain
VIVEEAVPQAEVRAVIVASGGDLLRSVDLFDVYRGPQIGAGKKSLAYALTFQAADRTLTDEDVAPVVQTIVSALAGKLGASIRS